MRGPQNDAGLKIQLHDQGEVPSMSDQGFAVAPGTHTLVGVQRVEVILSGYRFTLPCAVEQSISI